jgi:hypothetical protein
LLDIKKALLPSAAGFCFLGWMGKPSSLTPRNKPVFSLYVQPVRHFQYQRPVLVDQTIREVIVGIDDEQIGYRGKTPLETGVDVDVFDLGVVLDKRGPKDTPGKGEVKTRSYEQ